jgi:hypothetical protein
LFEVRLLSAPRRSIESLGPTDQEDVLRILGLIAEDPYVDGRNKFPFPLRGETVMLYDSPLFWVAYRFDDQTTVRVMAIGHAGAARRQ